MTARAQSRRRTIAFVASALFAGVVRAEPPAPPQELTAQFADGSNIHLAGHAGAINRRSQITMKLRLLAGQKLTAEDGGTRYENNLYPSYSTQEQTEWKNRWTGTWKASGDHLQLDLTLADRTCSAWKAYSDAGKKEKQPCAAVTKTLRLECQSEVITVEERGPAAAAAAPPGKQSAWLCTLASTGSLGETPLPWVFGTSGCIRTVPLPFGGRRSYQPCQASP